MFEHGQLLDDPAHRVCQLDFLLSGSEIRWRIHDEHRSGERMNTYQKHKFFVPRRIQSLEKDRLVRLELIIWVKIIKGAWGRTINVNIYTKKRDGRNIVAGSSTYRNMEK